MLSDAASRIARQIDASLWAIVLIDLVLLVGVTAAIVLFAVRYRRSARKRVKLVRGHLALEIAWTVIPTALVIGMFFIGYESFVAVRTPPPGAFEVRVNAQRWYWSFEYPEHNLVSTELYLPKGRAVRFTITSAPDDVLHSFYLPAFRIKEDAVPGMETHAWIEPDTIGIYDIFCAEFCGDEHSQMLTKLHVVEPEAFERWLREQAQGRREAVAVAEALRPHDDPATLTAGQKLFDRYCKSCHGADGRGGGVYGARNLTSLEGWKRGAKRSDLFDTLAEGLPGTPMRPFRFLPVGERVALMSYVVSFADASRPEPTEEDLARLRQRYPELNPGQEDELPMLPATPIDEAMKRVVEERRPAPAEVQP
jgi:cytochrome c oxidase subunit 2